MSLFLQVANFCNNKFFFSFPKCHQKNKTYSKNCDEKEKRPPLSFHFLFTFFAAFCIHILAINNFSRFCFVADFVAAVGENDDPLFRIMLFDVIFTKSWFTPYPCWFAATATNAETGYLCFTSSVSLFSTICNIACFTRSKRSILFTSRFKNATTAPSPIG